MTSFQSSTDCRCRAHRHTLASYQVHTDKRSQSWIGDWWEGWSFACLAWCLATDMDRLIRSQLHSDLFRSIHSDPNSLSLTQIHPISIRYALTHTDFCNLIQICSSLCSFTQIRSDSQNFTQSHSDSLNLAQKCSDPFRCTQIHSDSLSLAPDSL